MTDQSSEKPRVTASTNYTANDKPNSPLVSGKQPGATKTDSLRPSATDSSTFGLQKRLSEQEARIRKLDAEFSRRLTETKDAELALVSRIGDVDDDRRQDSVRLQRTFQNQQEEIGGRIDRTRGLLVTLLILFGVIAAGALGFLYYEVTKGRQTLAADLAGQRQQLQGLGERVADTQRLSEQLVSTARENEQASAETQRDDSQSAIDAERLERMQIANREQLEQLQAAHDQQLERLQVASKEQLERLSQSIEALQRKIDELQTRRQTVDSTSSPMAALANIEAVEASSKSDAASNHNDAESASVTTETDEAAEPQGLDAANSAALDDRLGAASDTEGGQQGAVIPSAATAQAEEGAPAGAAPAADSQGNAAVVDTADADDALASADASAARVVRSAFAENADDGDGDGDGVVPSSTTDTLLVAGGTRARAKPPSPEQLRQRPYSVQLMGFYTMKLLRHYLSEHDEVPNDAVYMRRTRKGRPWYVLIHSFHESAQSARQTAGSLPESLASSNVWVQPVKPDAKLYKLPD